MDGYVCCGNVKLFEEDKTRPHDNQLLVLQLSRQFNELMVVETSSVRSFYNGINPCQLKAEHLQALVICCCHGLHFVCDQVHTTIRIKRQ